MQPWRKALSRSWLEFFLFSFFFLSFFHRLSLAYCAGSYHLSRPPFRRVISAKTRSNEQPAQIALLGFTRVALSSGPLRPENQTRSIELCRVPYAPCSYVSRARETFREIDRGWAIARFRAFWLFQPFPVFNGASCWILLPQPAAFVSSHRNVQRKPFPTVSNRVPVNRAHSIVPPARRRTSPLFSSSRCPL